MRNESESSGPKVQHISYHKNAVIIAKQIINPISRKIPQTELWAVSEVIKSINLALCYDFEIVFHCVVVAFGVAVASARLLASKLNFTTNLARCFFGTNVWLVIYILLTE